MIKIYNYGEVPNSEIFARENISANVEDIVAEIIADVRKNGDEALFAYSKKFDASDIWLLYPMTDEFRAGNDVDIKFDSGDGTVVHVYFVDVADIDISLSRLKGRLETGG